MATKSTSEVKKDRKFVFEIWKESESYVLDEVLERVKALPQYAFILHDKDIDDDGNNKKHHYQGVAKFETAITLECFARKLGIPVNLCQFAKRFKGAERYLMHLDNPEKFQYSRSEVVTNIPSFDADCGLLHEGTIMQAIFDTIDGGTWNAYDIAKSACSDARYYSVVRRNWSIILGYCKFQSGLFEMAERERERVLAGKKTYAAIDMDIVNEILKIEREKKL